MARPEITADLRDITGKKVKALRRDGMLPAVIYGVKSEPVNVTVQASEIMSLIRAGQETELMDVHLSDQVRTVIIQDIQQDPVTEELLHVDFYEPDLTQPVDVTVAVELVGEPPAVSEKRGVLLKIVEEVPVRVLPTAIPPHIEVDISSLEDVGDQISIVDVELPDGVELMLETPEDVIVAKIGALRAAQVEEEEEQTEEAEETDEEASESSKDQQEE